MAENMTGPENTEPAAEKEGTKVSKGKRIAAIIAVVLIIAIYIVGLVFAFIGKGYAISVVMSCILIASYLAVYFHAGQVLARMLRKRKEKYKGDDQDGETDNTAGV